MSDFGVDQRQVLVLVLDETLRILVGICELLHGVIIRVQSCQARGPANVRSQGTGRQKALQIRMRHLPDSEQPGAVLGGAAGDHYLVPIDYEGVLVFPNFGCVGRRHPRMLLRKFGPVLLAWSLVLVAAGTQEVLPENGHLARSGSVLVITGLGAFFLPECRKRGCTISLSRPVLVVRVKRRPIRTRRQISLLNLCLFDLASRFDGFAQA